MQKKTFRVADVKNVGCRKGKKKPNGALRNRIRIIEPDNFAQEGGRDDGRDAGNE